MSDIPRVIAGLAVCRCAQCEWYRNGGDLPGLPRGKTTITFAGDGAGIQMGDVITFSAAYRPWWKRLWHWLIRYTPPENKVYTVTDVGSTTLTVK